jgi:anti-sigma factor RsiW
MNEPQTPADDDRGLDEQLVSYLDGELDAAESREVEEALAQNPRVRQELQQLERSWQLLDELPRTQVDESFTRSTVEMIAVQAEKDLVAIQAQLPQRRRRVWLVAAGALLTAAVAGFLSSTVLTQRADEKLLSDLPVIENFDQYREVEDLEFLRMLKSQGFLEPKDKHER